MKPTLRMLTGGLALVAAIATTTSSTSPVAAASGDVGNVDFAAPLHDSYDHATGGGFYGDGSNTYVRGELLGENFACGDRASFLAAFTTAAAPVAVTPFSVEVTMKFTTDTTGQSGAALFPIVDSPMINIGDTALIPSEPTAYVDGEATIMPTGEPYTNGAYEQIMFTVAGLEPSQTVVVRTDARIACPYLPNGDSPTGNLQATLEAVVVLDPPNPPADSGTGRQTVNLRRVQNFTNLGEPALSVTKTAVVEGQECPGVAELTVPLGIAVDYCYDITNFGSGPAIDLVVVDDMTTPDDPSDDVTLTLDGLSDEDGDQNADDLGEGSATAVLGDVTYDEIGAFTNVATASESAFSVTADGEATVTTEDVLSVTKSRTGSGVPELRDTISYEIVATNTSEVLTLDDVTITDDNATIGSCTPAMPASLAPGEALTCSATHEVTLDDAEAGSVSNTAEATASFSGHQLSEPSNEVVVPVAAPPVTGLTLQKSRIGSGTPDLGDTITYRLVATNTGDRATLDDVTITDDNATIGSCTPAAPATLAPGETMQCSATHLVTMADAEAGTVVNVAEAAATYEGAPVGARSNEVVVPVAAPPIPELTLVKTRVGNDPVNVGDTITYRITATNVGDRLTLDDIVIIDSNATITSCTQEMPATLAPGESLTCTAERVVTAADAAAGQITNVASVDGYSAETDVSLADVASNSVVVSIPRLTELPATGNGRQVAGTALTIIAIGGGLWLLANRRRTV